MAYSTAASPYLMINSITGGLISTSTAVTPGFFNLYAFRTTDASSVWMASNYITNATDIGMRKYDIVFVANTGSTIFGAAMVTAVSSGYATLGTLWSTA